MRKITLIISGALLMQSVMAQKVDRSKPPKAGPAPVITIADPATYKLANGITVLVVENHKLPKVTATYTIDAGPVKEGEKAGVMSLMGGMLGEGTTSKSKAVFDEQTDQIGAVINLSSSSATASALTRYFDKAFSLMAEAIQSPAMEQSSFDKLKSQTITGLKTSERSAKAIADRVTGALLYGKDHPYGEFETEASVSKLTLDDVKNAYKQYITPSRGFLTFVGDIKPEQAKALAEKAFGSWKGASLSLPALENVKNVPATEIDLVDVPNAVQSEIRVTNLVNLPLGNPDYFPVLLANQILGGGSEGYLFMDLREKYGFTYGAYSRIEAGRFQRAFQAYASVRNEKTDSAVAEFVKMIKRIVTEPATAAELQTAKALYNGGFALDMENPARIAGFATNIILNNLPKDFYKTYLQKINAVTIDDVQRVARKYFTIENARIVIAGKASQISEGLKKLGYPVHQFDKYGQPVTENAAAAAATGVDAKKVVADYIQTIGGNDELKKIQTIWSVLSVNMQGITLTIDQKLMAPNKELMTTSMMGNVVSKQVFDGTTGYREQQGNKMPLPDDDLNAKKSQTNLVEQVWYLSDAAIKLENKGTEKVNGKDAYKILISFPGGKTQTEYYDVSSKLLVRQESAAANKGVTINKTVDFSDYKKTGNVLFANKQTLTMEAGGQQQTLELQVTSIKLNEGITADDFK